MVPQKKTRLSLRQQKTPAMSHFKAGEGSHVPLLQLVVTLAEAFASAVPRGCLLMATAWFRAVVLYRVPAALLGLCGEVACAYNNAQVTADLQLAVVVAPLAAGSCANLPYTPLLSVLCQFSVAGWRWYRHSRHQQNVSAHTVPDRTLRTHI